MVAVMHEYEDGRGCVKHRQQGRLTGKGLAWLVSKVAGEAM